MTRPFKYCPSDGTRLAEPGNDAGAKCPGCGRAWYHNAAPTAGGVIVADGRALITKRAREPEKGRYDIPGGFLDPDEDPITGLKREVKEELSVDVEVDTGDIVQMVPHRYGDDGDWVLALGFIVRSFSGDPVAADDVADIRWITRDELDDVDFAWEHDRALVRKALENS